MKILKKKMRPKFEVQKVLCNKCGHRCDFYANKDHISVDVTWGYFSKKDFERHQFDVCEKCYDNFVKTFIHKPNKIST